MVGVYGFIFVSFIVTIIMLRLQRDNYFFFADVFYSYTEWLVRNIIKIIIKFFLMSFYIVLTSVCLHGLSLPIYMVDSDILRETIPYVGASSDPEGACYFTHMPGPPDSRK